MSAFLPDAASPDGPAMTDKTDVLVIGAGPAGLTAAYELCKHADDLKIDIFEASDQVGGISRTVNYKGFRIDIGGHRFFTKLPEVQAMWKEVLGTDFIRVPRLSRIFYRGKYYDYPLKLMNALGNIGPYESIRIMLSYLKWQVRPSKTEDSFEEWVINRFGGRLYMHFFRSYTEKVWGVSPKEIRADWAAQRIKNLSLFKAVWNAISGSNNTTSLIEEFDYPRLGPGMMWEKTTDLLRAHGASVHMETPVLRLERSGNRIVAAHVTEGDDIRRVEADHFVNSMDLRRLILNIDPPPPDEVVAAAHKLRYRDFLIVGLVIDHPDPFPDNWVYVHSADVKVGRIQNFRAWSPEMVPNDTHASIGMEYFCQEGDGLWTSDDETLIALAAREMEQLGLARADEVVDGTVVRQPKAYPVYDTDYREAVETIAEWCQTLENFQTCGRNGLHRYNNQDHSMITAMFAARCILGGDYNVWDVNVERSYHEEFQRPVQQPSSDAAPATPPAFTPGTSLSNQ